MRALIVNQLIRFHSFLRLISFYRSIYSMDLSLCALRALCFTYQIRWTLIIFDFAIISTLILLRWCKYINRSRFFKLFNILFFTVTDKTYYSVHAHCTLHSTQKPLPSNLCAHTQAHIHTTVRKLHGEKIQLNYL